MPAQKRQRVGHGAGAAGATRAAQDTPSRLIAAHLVRSDGGVLMLTGAGIEMDSIAPNVCHALGALVSCTGGALVTTNITDATLLAMPDEHDTSFVAPHGTMCDQKGRVQRRRPRSYAELELPLLGERGVYTEIPITVDPNDPNVLDTRRAAAAPQLKTLLIMGNSIIKKSNGRALNFLEAATAIDRVIFVNPDTSRVASDIQEELRLWGLRGKPEVACVHSTGVAFADEVLSQLQRELRERCTRWVAPAEVARKRRLLQLPPKDLGGRENHELGGTVHVGELFDEMQRMHRLARSAVQ